MIKRFLRTLVPAAWILATAAFGQSGGNPHRVRLTETSITETGRLSGIANTALTTRGYGIGYISPLGVGGAYTCLNTFNRGGATKVDLDLCYADVNYTYAFGNYVLLTMGAGVGVKSVASLEADGIKRNLRHVRSSSLSVGPGVALGSFEVYWIYRRTWVSFKHDEESFALASRLFQLGLGWHF